MDLGMPGDKAGVPGRAVPSEPPRNVNQETALEMLHASRRNPVQFSTSNLVPLRASLRSVLAFFLLNTTATLAATSLHLHPREITLPLRVTNNCNEPIWPAILTQSGIGPASSGFVLGPGDTNPQTVSGDWRGRVWARTNCSFPNSSGAPLSGQGGTACTTGDCGMFLECQGAVSGMSREDEGKSC